MTKQQYYNLLVKSARDGTFPSLQAGVCQYRGPKGAKCAIGVLISDAAYDATWEGRIVTDLPANIREAIKPSGMTERSLRAIQRLHDELAHEGWDTKTFIQSLNSMPCFKGCKKVKP